MGDRFVWVLKDPLSRAFFYFSDREFSILKLLDGRRQISEIIAACRERLAPDFVAAESVITFLADAKQNGLITSSATGTDSSGFVKSGRSSQPSRWKNLLAIRLPGVNPDRLLDLVKPRIRFLFSPPTFVAAALFGMLAVIMVVVNFDVFVADVGAAASRTSWSWLMTVVVVVSLTKIIHELAHAVSCKVFGAECREIGVMFLVGIPCLYCDVSDAWVLGQRFKRIIVSAAGMFAELVIATAAAFGWMISNDGIVRDICVTTMIVCSISTVLFNGNPLLRYDGYFILSDLLGIPNLASESSGLIRGALRRKLWGLPSISNRSTQPESKRVGQLVVYGVLSGVYRFAVLTLICLVLYRFAAAMGVGFVGGCLAAAFLLSTIYRSVHSVIRPPSTLESRSANASRRPALIFGVIGLLVLLALFLPLPRSIVAPTTIDAADAVDVFLESPGQLVSAIAPGADVQQGDEIARFRNNETEQALLGLETRRQTLRAELASLVQRRSLDARAAGRIPSVTEALEAANNDYQELREEAERLVIRAPQSGRLFAARNRHQVVDEEREIRTWDDTPLNEKNQGAYFDEGTLLCSIGNSIRRDAVVLVRQQDIAMVRLGQSVQLLTPAHIRGGNTGIVTEVASSPILDVPREFFAAGLVDRSPDSGNVGETRNTYYQVRVRLSAGEAPLVIRSTTRARIKVQPASLAARLIRFLSDSFRFQW